MTRYHPLLVALHWTTALLISVSLVHGFSILDEIPEGNAAKLGALRLHMIFGGFILVLMVARLIIRLRTKKPPEPDSGHAVLNKIARPIHYIVYGTIFAIIGTGIAMSVMAGLPPIVFGGSDSPLPVSFDDLPSRAAHGYLALVLVALITLHFCAIFYHEAVRGTDLLKRIWFGERT
jgi:cytochrome b561